MEGDLLEIDQDSLGAVERVKGFLLDNFLVTAVFVSNKYVILFMIFCLGLSTFSSLPCAQWNIFVTRLGPGRFKLKSVFEVDNIGVVNVHDMEGKAF